MPSSNSENAFDTLLREVEQAMARVNQEGAVAFQSGDYDAAKALMEEGQALSDLAGQLAALRGRWNELLDEDEPQIKLDLRAPKPAGRGKKWSTKKIKKGLKTHEDEYRVPILQALIELGGSSNLQPVIDRVGEIMKPILNEYDYMTLKSEPNTPRWRNTTQWVRYSLVQEGLMRSDSPVGTWEISDKGRLWLKQQ